MRISKFLAVTGGLCAVLAMGVIAARDNPPAPGIVLQGKQQPPLTDDKDQQAIRKASSDFARAFDSGDAKAVASFWTPQGEYHEENGEVIRGRAAIEEAFNEFFKERPKCKIEVHIESVRFPSRDSAIEEGILRQVSASNDLPTTSKYSVLHVREDGQWKIALAREWGAGEDRLEDLEWLIGVWHAKTKDKEMRLEFSKDMHKPFLVGEVTIKTKGKVVASSNMKIGFDAQRGQLRSWHFEEDGGHGQALWIRDGNRWVLDASGVMADGTETGALNILGRINDNEFTWRSIDRVIGDEKLPDTVPIKLSRVIDKK